MPRNYRLVYKTVTYISEAEYFADYFKCCVDNALLCMDDGDRETAEKYLEKVNKFYKKLYEADSIKFKTDLSLIYLRLGFVTDKQEYFKLSKEVDLNPGKSKN